MCVFVCEIFRVYSLLIDSVNVYGQLNESWTWVLQTEAIFDLQISPKRESGPLFFWPSAVSRTKSWLVTAASWKIPVKRDQTWEKITELEEREDSRLASPAHRSLTTSPDQLTTGFSDYRQYFQTTDPLQTRSKNHSS